MGAGGGRRHDSAMLGAGGKARGPRAHVNREIMEDTRCHEKGFGI